MRVAGYDRGAFPPASPPFRTALLIIGALAVAGCKKGDGAGGAGVEAAQAVALQDGGSVVVGEMAANSEPTEPEEKARLDELWTRAKDGDEGDRARLVDRIGMRGVLARVDDATYRATAIRALGLTEGFEALPRLAAIGKGASEADADVALEGAVEMASRPRRAVDPEDAAELRDGCAILGAIAQDGAARRARRVAALRALRMLKERGCTVPSAESGIDPQLDAR